LSGEEKGCLIQKLPVGNALTARNDGSGEKWFPALSLMRQGPVSYFMQTERGIRTTY